ncbi:MAG: putative two-component sensor histidine kinase [Chloroflexi bacterium OLB14]|nr:MAG: putative two-component sensor histidine kinase [Chloroflexi bacterium OLB14]
MPKKDLILLAIDESSVTDLVQKALHAAGFDVAIVHEQMALNNSIQEAIPELIIVGEKFSGRDWLSITDEILGRFPTIPIILYAKQDTTGYAKSALRAGLSGYLYPPLKMEDIVFEVQRCMTRARGLGDWLRREVKRTTASLQEKAKISESERIKLEAIISNIQDGLILLDDNENILMTNQNIRQIFLLGEKPIAGKWIRAVISNADLHALLDQSKADGVKYYEIHFDDGKVFNAQYTHIPRVGYAITMQDISYLKELNRLKSDFIHTVSHDLRSPLTAILGYMELIERTGPLNEDQTSFLRRLQESVQHITNLVNELLELGKLEAGFDVRRETVHLQLLLKHSLDIFEEQIKKKNIKLKTVIEDHVKAIHANPIRIRQMFDNLIGNAIKYTPAGGNVNIMLGMQANQALIKVQDTGPGIPLEEQNRIFEKFYRASNRPEKVEGSGLGLAIVKSIVDSHQGRVWVESKSGEGSTFVVLLPALES